MENSSICDKTEAAGKGGRAGQQRKTRKKPATLDERVKELKDYLCRIEVADGMLIVRVRLKKGWKVMKNLDQDFPITITKDDKTPDEYLYWAKNDNVTLDDVFDYVEKTIDYNRSLELKVELLMKKVSELTDIFNRENDLEVLEKLRFVYGKPGRRAGAKTKNGKENGGADKDATDGAEKLDDKEAVE